MPHETSDFSSEPYETPTAKRRQTVSLSAELACGILGDTLCQLDADKAHIVNLVLGTPDPNGVIHTCEVIVISKAITLGNG
jgi:hypothetical protein